MKKKIGDFMLSEIKAECEKHEVCDGCVFEDSSMQFCNIASWSLDEEIEIQEE